ncbi:hypothetical protein [Pedobacter zeae]|uniref:Uncharacterized protein n=1 Tax=Pedobacter zeae TaxID=1737356 RepID=A0A7W6P704_9SPHI|nr:hypothetical protein [Pedobacter zeae]MBB4108501.1 hypothetical protein [Pedobacter zeae]GGG92389.1 hypothetical protein GCM10007422_01790 [Pedobacter zeae]
MKKKFKSSPLIICLLYVLVAMSCKKEIVTDSVDQEIKFKKKLAVTPETPNPGGGLGSFVVLNENGDYVTSYGGGINFGNTFTYPLSVQSYQNGTPYTPYYSGGYSPSNMLSFTQNGPHFTMLLGTVVGGMTTNTYDAISAYNTAFNNYINGTGDLTSFPQYSTYAVQYGGSSDGILTINGTFVLDTQSPTHVSVTNIKYIVAAVE